MVEDTTEKPKVRLGTSLWNSIELLSFVSYIVYLLYMSVILPFIIKYYIPIDFAGSVLLYIILLVIVAFIFWLIIFYLQLSPHFYNRPTKFTYLSKRDVSLLFGLIAIIFIVISLPAYFISIVLPFAATEDQITAKQVVTGKKRKL
ncbi:MAG: hypothetical protein ACFE95_23425 [Candidatus Hodarchaeota archaeon]